MSKIKTGIIGAAGYTGGELIRLLINHPDCELTYIHSNSQVGKKVYEVHSDMIGDCDLTFTNEVKIEGLDAVFLGLPHGQTKAFLEENPIDENIVIIDLSTDFRDESGGFVYGLPEINFEKIRESKRIANPGCFATAIQLGLLPAIKEGWAKEAIHISGITGSTGAGKKLSETSHFSYRNNNFSVYKLFNHQHLKEISQSFKQVSAGINPILHFVPYRGNFTRGIWITSYFPFEGNLEEAVTMYSKFYEKSPFTTVSVQDLSLKQVVNTNKCLIHLQKDSGQLVIYSIIDNLLKGASGQAVQNFNIAFGLDQKAGLKLKASVF